MAKLKDCRDREWVLRITNGDIEPVRDHCGVELNKLLANLNQFAELLYGDPVSLGKVIWILCEEQVKERGLSEREFGKGFDGPTIDRAATALMEAVADFSPRSPVGQAIKKGWTRILEAADRRTTARIDEAVEKALREMGQTSGP
ncbi:hypothetical protein [Zavarzinella formosa]|uniref:hypothetical protein n=1 Tax=Zavarzinella formosa TaxID=360055 RepID=UPI0002DDC426|nr:hypothetical protein [Zavarzinella formosa]